MAEAPDLREQEDCPNGRVCNWSCDQHMPKRIVLREQHLSECMLLAYPNEDWAYCTCEDYSPEWTL